VKQSDRYLKIVEWSDEDRCYVGTCPGLMWGGIHGNDEIAVYAELCEAVEEWLRIHEADREPLPPPTAGRRYSGRFVHRVGEDLHKRLVLDALRRGVSLNTHCVQLLEAGAGKHIRSRARAKEGGV
jgi:predicted HicB family RNase H-like nuclease